jgi:hypothetical protein
MAENKHKDFVRFDLDAGYPAHAKTSGDYRVYLDPTVYGLKGIDYTGNIKSIGAIQDTSFRLLDVPTSDPHVSGQFWNLSGTVHISTG